MSYNTFKKTDSQLVKINYEIERIKVNVEALNINLRSINKIMEKTYYLKLIEMENKGFINGIKFSRKDGYGALEMD
tara:strand:- start:186 stop:413 length:228 start_codon:yes stop_codon:yes gene_type:complete